VKYIRLIVANGEREFTLDQFAHDGGHTHNTMRFDVCDQTNGKTICIDLPFEDAVKLSEALTGFIEDHPRASEQYRLDHVASIVADQALTPAERLAMLADEFRPTD
jgi:hypothetical protein